MNTQDDSISVYLACRHYLYELLQHTFGHEPNIELLEYITCDYTQSAVNLFLDVHDDKIENINHFLNELRSGLNHETQTTLDKFTSEYTHLFIGPNKLPAPPWESVYISKKRLIFHESTLIVRRKYLEYQFLPEGYPNEADDHLALELNFMAHLARDTEDLFNKQNLVELKKLLLDQKAFLEEHLLVWITEFADQIQNSRTHYLYPQMARFTESVLKTDGDNLNELIDLLYPDAQQLKE